MGGFSAAALREVLASSAPAGAAGWVVAVSGGVDSACLLRALAEQPCRALRVRAVHIDHALQPAAAGFRRASIDLCGLLAIPLEIVTVEVETRGSIEAAARTARYAALAQNLRPQECLLTAHHALDQAETLLLQLLRGAGLKGMAAMPACRPFGTGWHLRPLLGFSKRDLLEFAAAAGAAAVDDPMNDDVRFDRAYLRTQLWPLIERRWPGGAAALSRTATHAAEAQELLDESAALIVSKLGDGNALSVSGLRRLPAAQQRNALRYWIAAAGLALPSTARLIEALRQIVDADDDHLPAVIFGDHALRRYRDRLFLTAAVPPALPECLEWSARPDACLDLGEGLGRLRWLPQVGGLDAARLRGVLTVRRREGGEMLRPHARARTHSVQHLCQSLGVLPWMRSALPLVHAGETLIAIGDLWQDAGWCVAAPAEGLGCVWEGAPALI